MRSDSAAVSNPGISEAHGDPRRWLALPALLIGAFLPVLDFNVVNLALPAIRQDLGATSSEVQFVISAYAASYAVFLITGGRLGDWFGRKQMFLLGVAGFTLASALCGFAWSPSALIAGRVLQGLTATLMAPQVLASIRVLFPSSEQEKALGLYGATFGLANIAGQIMGRRTGLSAAVWLHAAGRGRPALAMAARQGPTAMRVRWQVSARGAATSLLSRRSASHDRTLEDTGSSTSFMSVLALRLQMLRKRRTRQLLVLVSMFLLLGVSILLCIDLANPLPRLH